MPAPLPTSRQPPSPADGPERDRTGQRDRTSLVVRLGLLLLLAIGVISVFGEHLLGVAAPAGDDPATGGPGPAHAPVPAQPAPGPQRP